MAQLIDTIDGKALYADRALKDANGKQIDTTYDTPDIVLTYGQTPTQSNTELDTAFRSGKLYVLLDSTQQLRCTFSPTNRNR